MLKGSSARTVSQMTRVLTLFKSVSKKPRSRLTSRALVAVAALCLTAAAWQVQRAFALTTTFIADFESGTLNANYAFGSCAASTDGTLPTIVSPGYGGTGSGILNSSGTTLKYSLANNLNSAKGEIEFKYKLPWFLGVDQSFMYFNGPYDITYDNASGYYYAADTGNHRIVRTKADGVGWEIFGSYGAGAVQFNSPTALYYDAASEYLYINDTSNYRIVKTKWGGTGWTTYGSYGTPAAGKFRTMAGIDYDPATGFIYTFETYSNYDRIVKTKIDGTGYTTYGASGTGVGQFNNPTGLDYDPASGYFYVSDYSNNRIVKTQWSGTGWTTYGAAGSGVGQFGSGAMRDIRYDAASDYIYVSDYGNSRIVKTKIDGTGWTIIPSYPALGLDYTAATDKVTYTTAYGIQSVSMAVAGAMYRSGSYSTAPAFDYDPATGYYYISDYSNNRIIKTKIDGTGWTVYGSYGSGVGQFYYPRGIDYDPVTDYIYVADYYNSRIVKTKLDGSWTGWATNNNSFSYPVGIDYDTTTGFIYVTGSSSIIKTKIDNTGRVTLSGFSSPQDVHYDAATDYLYVANYNNHNVVKTKIDGTGWTTYGSYGTYGTGKFNGPTAIFYDSVNDYVYVSDSSYRVIKTKMDGTGWTQQFGFNTNYGIYGVYFDAASGLLATMSNSGITSAPMQTGIGRNIAFPSRSYASPRAVSYDSTNGVIYALTSDGASVTRSRLNGTGWLLLGSSVNGSGTGQFSSASGLEFDPTSNYLYVADSGNHRIVKTKMDGSGWTTFGAYGSGTNQFYSPQDVHYDASTGFIYVADYSNNRIVKTKMDGSVWYVFPISSPKSVTVENGYIYVFSNTSPYATKIKDQNPSVLSAIASPGKSVYDPTTGYIFFADNTNSTIVKMKLDGTDVTTLTGFSNTTGLDYDPTTGFLYITDWSNSRIVKIKIDGTERTNYGSNGSGVGRFSSPRGISYDASTGFIYVADTGNNRIVKTKIDGTGWTTYGTNGSGVGNFSSPYSLVYESASDYIYVADNSNNRIVKTKIDGTGWTTYGTYGTGTGNFYSPIDISFDSSTGNIYVADYNNSRIVKTKIDGTGWTLYTTGQSIQYLQYNTSSHRLQLSVPNKSVTSLDFENFDAYRGANALNSNMNGVYGNGYWYLSENNSTILSRLVKTNMDGTDWTTLGSYGSSTNQFYSPYSPDYDSTNDFLYVPDRNNSRIVKTKMTGAGWTVLSTGVGEGEKTLFSTNGTQPLMISFYPFESKIGVDLARTDNGVGLAKSTVLTGDDGEWQTMKITYDNTSGVTVKINDVTVLEKTITWSSFAWGDSFYVGNNAYDNTKSFNGLIDDINISSAGSDNTNPSIPAISTAKDIEGGSNNLSADGWNRFATPYFTWTSTDEGGAGIKDYLVYFGTNANANPTLVGTAQTAASYSASGLVSGTTYYLVAQARDNAGNLSTKTTLFTYRYDGTAPQSPTMVTVDPPGNSRATHFDFTWPVEGAGTGSDTGGSSIQGYQYRIKSKAGNYSDWSAISNTGTASFDIPNPDTDYLGTNSIEIRAVDNAGNVDDTPLANNFYYSAATTAPRNLSVTPTGVSPSNTFTFDWAAPTSYPGLGYFYSINALPTADNKLTAADSGLPAGPYASQQGDNTLYVLAADGTNTNYDSCNTISGNPEVDGCSKITFSARTPAPGYPTGVKVYDISNRDTEEYAVALKWSAPTNLGTGFDGYNIYRSATETGTFSRIGASSGTSYIDDGLTKETPYFYQLKSKDNTGQTSISSETIDVVPTGRYTNPPTLKENSLQATPKAYSATLTWETVRTDSTETGAGQASSFVLYGTERAKMGKEHGGFTVGDPNKVESHSINLTGLQPSTVYYYQAMWEDVDGNQGLSEILTLTTKEKPEIAGVSADNITLTSANINWTSTNMVSARISYCSPTSCQDATIGSTPDLAKHTVNLANLAHSTHYSFTISTTDIDGNITPSDTYYFDTLTMPVIEGDLKMDQDTSAPTTTYRFRWTTNVETTTIMYYNREGEAPKSISKAEYTKEHDVTVSQLSDQSKYSFEASGVCVHGNKVDNPLKASVSTPQDSRAPKVSNLTIEIKSSGVSGSQKDQIVASWETDELATSQIEYGPGISGTDYGQKTQEDAALTNYHVVIVNELEPSKMYHLRVVSRDSAGNAGYSDDTTAITGKMQNSAIDLIINSLRKSLGWLSSIFQ